VTTYDSPPPRSRQRRSGFVARHLLALTLVAAAIVLVVENTHKVRIRALGPWVTTPLWAALASTLVAGMLILLLIQRRRRR
jgi:uncharacterized integral membrane protein